MKKINTARAIIHYPYESSNGKVYDSILLAREKASGKYGLPGGTIEQGEKAIDAVVRELQEEFQLVLDPTTAQKVYSFQGYTRSHDIFLFDNVSGRLKKDKNSLFLNTFSQDLY